MMSINGKPMIGHVYERVSRSPLLDQTVVATCDSEIFDYITSMGGQAVMTSSAHERASDRCAEALPLLEKKHNIRYDIVVMVQGDEPMTHPKMIEEAVQPMLEDCSVMVVNLLGKIKDELELEDRNCIKVVCDKQLNALYFSREPIPARYNRHITQWYKQVCIIPFRRDYLLRYASLKPTPLEVAESIDMLRVLENGDRVKMAHTKYETQSVDTLEDLKRAEVKMRHLN